MTRAQLLLVAPELVLTATALLLLLLNAVSRPRSIEWAGRLTALGLLGAGGVAGVLWGSWSQSSAEPFGLLRGDGLACFFNLLFAFGGLVSVLLAPRLLTTDPHVRALSAEFHALLLLSTVGMMLMAAASDLLMVFLGLETLSIPLYILCGLQRGRTTSIEAALKYLLLGSFATGFLVFGIALLFAATGSTDLIALREAAVPVVALGKHEASFLYAGIALLIIGLAFKVALVPFHQWTPDVYEGAPTPVTAFMSVGSKAAGFAAAYRVLGSPDGFGLIDRHWDGLLWVLAIATMVVGNLGGLFQTSLKRLLAYSGIAHAGYLLIGFLVHNDDGMAAVLFYLMAYAFMNLGAFAVVTLFGDPESGDLSLTQCSGLAERNLPAALALTLFMASLAGLPPTAGFFAKFHLLRAALVADLDGLVPLAIVAVWCSVVAVFYYLRPVVAMFMREATPRQAQASSAPSLSLAIIVCAAGVIGFGLWSHTLLDFAHASLTARR